MNTKETLTTKEKMQDLVILYELVQSLESEMR